MKTASAKEIGSRFDAYLKAAAKELVVVTRNSKPVAVLLAMTDPDDIERLAMSQSKELQKILQKSRDQIKRGEGIPHEEFWRQVKEMRKRQRSRPSHKPAGVKSRRDGTA